LLLKFNRPPRLLNDHRLNQFSFLYMNRWSGAIPQCSRFHIWHRGKRDETFFSRLLRQPPVTLPAFRTLDNAPDLLSYSYRKNLLSILLLASMRSPTGKARGTPLTPKRGDVPAKSWRIQPRPKGRGFLLPGENPFPSQHGVPNLPPRPLTNLTAEKSIAQAPFQ